MQGNFSHIHAGYKMSHMNPQLQLILQQAIQAFQNGNLDSAEVMLKRVLKVDVKNLPALHILGLIKASQANYKEAADLLGKAARLNPNDASIQYNLAKALSDSGNDKDALTHHKKAVALAPNNPESWINYGKSSSNLGRYEDALAYYSNALGLKADYAEAALNIGATLKELKRYQEAIEFAEQALTINPNLVEAWVNKGVSLKELKRYEEAITHYDKALSLKPDYAECLFNKGNALNELKRYDEAIAHYDQSQSLNANIDWSLGDLLHTKMKICLWTGLNDSLQKISKKIAEKERVITPFSLLALTDDVALQKKSSEIYVQNKHPSSSVLGKILRGPKNEKIRIGYFSPNFNNHAVAILTAELFELHNKDNFEIFAFSFGVDDKSSIRTRLSQAFNQFIVVSEMSDIQIASLSRELHIDIAVDLCGYTADNRTGIFAYRAAPIQVSYIGYLGTMGVDYMDYLIADKTIIPSGSEEFYSEKIAYLPSYQVNDRKRVVSEKVFARQELGLPEHGFVYCCFNNNYKIMPAVLDGWARILKAVDDSVLFLYADNQWAQSNLQKEIEARGVDGARLVFGRRIAMEDYLARYRACDLFLDTFPYNAGTTASDALWVGLPVLTLAGQSFASRVAASLLNAIELPELITYTQEEYESLAIELAKNPHKLESIKQNLANNRSTTALFDTPLFTKHLEIAYQEMIARYQKELTRDHISING
jgi:predicted O-linked N-acetylglucosamine transferase (SPINDLY family)